MGMCFVKLFTDLYIKSYLDFMAGKKMIKSHHSDGMVPFIVLLRLFTNI